MENPARSGADNNTLVALLRWRATHQPEQRAYTFLLDGEEEEANWNYEDVDQVARSFAAAIQNFCAGGERVLLLYPPGLEYIGAFFGCLYAGVVAVPAYPPRFNRNFLRLESIINDSQATLALTTPQIKRKLDALRDQAPYASRLQWLTLEDIGKYSTRSWHEPQLNSESPAFLQFTSGSTGSPKGVVLSHGNLMHNLDLIHRCFGVSSEIMGASWLPPYHDMGLIGGVLQPLYAGCKVILFSPLAFLQRPIRWLETITRYRVTHSGGPNFAYDLCLRRITAEQRASLDLSSWELAFNGAEPIRAETLRQFASFFEPCGFRRRAFYPCYGLAEGTLMVTGGCKTELPRIESFQTIALQQRRFAVLGANAAVGRTLVGCGRTMPGQKVVIADPEHLTQCAEGEVGEIWVSGSSVAQGYWNRPAETEQIFRAHLMPNGEGPFLRTGDLGFLLHEELFVMGRSKDLIIIRGRNHYPQDIELTAEQSHPATRPGCGAAFSIELDGQEHLVVVQETEHQHQRNPPLFQEMLAAIRQAIAEEHEVAVSHVVLVKPGSIPKTSSGKVQRRSCREKFLASELEVLADWHVSLAAQPTGYRVKSVAKPVFSIQG